MDTTMVRLVPTKWNNVSHAPQEHTVSSTTVFQGLAPKVISALNKRTNQLHAGWEHTTPIMERVHHLTASFALKERSVMHAESQTTLSTCAQLDITVKTKNNSAIQSHVQQELTEMTLEQSIRLKIVGAAQKDTSAMKAQLSLNHAILATTAHSTRLENMHVKLEPIAHL